MKLIEQTVTVMELPINPDEKEALQFIERVGRTCYKSEDKITLNSADKFVKGLISRKHDAMLEHVRIAIVSPIGNLLEFFPQTVKHFAIVPVLWNGIARTLYCGNVRAWRDIFRFMGEADETDNKFKSVCSQFNMVYSSLFTDIMEKYGVDETDWLDDFPVQFPLMKNITYLDEKHRLDVEGLVLRMVTNRGITHELVRHRAASFAQESTRYVNYGGKEINFIRPVWMDDETFRVAHLINTKDGSYYLHEEAATEQLYRKDIVFLRSCKKDEDEYNEMIKYGAKPEEAREVLPNALASEIIMSGPMTHWRHFFNLRALGVTGRPHPQMQPLAKSALKMANDLHPWAFSDMVESIE